MGGGSGSEKKESGSNSGERNKGTGGGCLSGGSRSVSLLQWLPNTCDPLAIRSNLAGG